MIRIVNLKNYKQTEGEILIKVDRSNKILGNKLIMKNESERDYVGDKYQEWFYTQITFKPDEMAENLHKSAGFVPGIRPGEATEKYFEKLLTKVSIIGGLFAAFLAVTPILVGNYISGVQFGGTSLLILIGVGLDFSRQLDSQLVMRHYDGFLK